MKPQQLNQLSLRSFLHEGQEIHGETFCLVADCILQDTGECRVFACCFPHSCMGTISSAHLRKTSAREPLRPRATVRANDDRRRTSGSTVPASCGTSPESRNVALVLPDAVTEPNNTAASCRCRHTCRLDARYMARLSSVGKSKTSVGGSARPNSLPSRLATWPRAPRPYQSHGGTLGASV